MNAQRLSFRFFLSLFILQANIVLSQSLLPKPDHIVMVILENHSFNQIIGSSAAPYINSLANDTSSALFTQSYGITHPSQPNYLILYSGSNQGVTDDLLPAGNPFTSANVGRQLIDLGKTFLSYSEDLPSVGYNGELSGNYARRHNPVANWMGSRINQLSPTTNQPFTSFPAGNFELLPTLCLVNPNTVHDMHDGNDPSRITSCDQWISNNMDAYIQWAKSNNSLFILTFDEDNDSSLNRITTIFSGKMIQSGQYSSSVNHYSILHTIEKMYGLPYIGDSLTVAPIVYCWKQKVIPDSVTITDGKIYPDPSNGLLYIELTDYINANADIYNLKGQLIQSNHLLSKKTEVNIGSLINGYYLLKIKNKEGITVSRFIKN
jgi:acid phosphatase